MNTIKLTKMQGLGNDFVVLDYDQFEKSGLTMSELAKKLCDRNFGVGADGMIIPNVNTKNTDIGWFFYNSDGTTAQMCGNGMRCFAKYIYDKGLIKSKKFTVETLAGVITPEILENGQVKVNMSKPILDWNKIPFAPEPRPEIQQQMLKPVQHDVVIEDKTFTLNPVSMGNPHCVIFTDENIDFLAETYGPKLENHKFFPEKTNVEFIRIKSKSEIDLRVYERGCGITLACGTGACASVVAAILNNLTENKVKVNLLGGALTIEWQGSPGNIDNDVFMTGDANYTFFAEFIL